MAYCSLHVVPRLGDGYYCWGGVCPISVLSAGEARAYERGQLVSVDKAKDPSNQLGHKHQQHQHYVLEEGEEEE